MSDPKELFEGVEAVLQRVFEGALPPWGLRAIGIAILLGMALVAIAGALKLLAEIRKTARELLPLVRSDDERRRALKRRLFADHLDAEIRRLNGLESWQDYRFTELEAEVEAEGERRESTLLGLLTRRSAGLRRERSLSAALRRSEERLILLEGEPGAGKSVALRHLAQLLTVRARRSRSSRSLIPLYVNLKEFQPRDIEIDRKSLRGFILRYLNRINDRDVEEFLEEEFDRGVREGTWIFLFDSFDEIPAVLGATEADITVRRHADAIADFLHGMNQCRAIVASRVFRGPAHTPWPRFRILPLQDSRRSELVRRAGLAAEAERRVIDGVSAAGPDIRLMASNPMFLGLLCDHVRSGQAFPANAHLAFDAYIDRRLNRDRDRLERRYNLGTARLKATAEAIAFAMTADQQLGLSPTRASIKNALVALGRQDAKEPDVEMDALEYLKLGRAEAQGTAADERAFTFAHRRFQEYFATCLVLREPGLLSPRRFLLDARWRETAVVLCQTRSAAELGALLDEAAALLANAAAQVVSSKAAGTASEFSWPAYSTHLLGLLQEGFTGRGGDLSVEIREAARTIVEHAIDEGSLVDRKWAVEVAAPMPESAFLDVLRRALSDGSRWLKEVAYRQAGRLGRLPPDLRAEIRGVLADMALSGRLARDRYATEAHLRRLANHQGLLSTATLLSALRPIDFALHALWFIGCFVVLLPRSPLSQLPDTSAITIGLTAVALSHLLLRLGFQPAALAAGRSVTTALASMLILIVSLRPGETVYMHADETVVTFVVLALPYVLFWAPAAIMAARTERFVHPALWVLAPLAVPVHLVHLARRYPVTTMWILIGALGWVAASLGTVFLFSTANSPLPATIQAELSSWFEALMRVIAAGVAGLWILSWGRIKKQDLTDWVRWRRWASARRVVQPRELAAFVGSFRTPKGKARVLRSVRMKGMLDLGLEPAGVLVALLREQEHILRTMNDACKRLTSNTPGRWRLRFSYRQLLANARFGTYFPRFVRFARAPNYELVNLIDTHGDFEGNLDLRDEISILLDQVGRRSIAPVSDHDDAHFVGNPAATR